jgi:hypothetical protein
MKKEFGLQRITQMDTDFYHLFLSVFLLLPRSARCIRCATTFFISTARSGDGGRRRWNHGWKAGRGMGQMEEDFA